jgi:DNA-binding response OmpR family regulator
MSDRLFVVDDDEVIRETLRVFFEREGFQVETAGALAEAADLLAVRSYAAVIVDVCLSEQGTEGLTLVSYIREAGADLPVLILTAYGSPQNAVAAAQLGADAFLHKPVSLVWLKDLMRARIAARRGERAEGPNAPLARVS